MCKKCKRPSCIHPKVCPNLNTDHSPLLDIYHAVDSLPGIKKSFIGSGVRYDLLLYQSKDPKTNKSTQEYTRELIVRHVSGRLKVRSIPRNGCSASCANRHSASSESSKRYSTVSTAKKVCDNSSSPTLSPATPAARKKIWRELAVITKRLDFHLEQVQDFTPTPMTVATEAWYTVSTPIHWNPYSVPRPSARNWRNVSSSSGTYPKNGEISSMNCDG